MISLVTEFERAVGPLAGVLTSAEGCFESWRSRTVSERGSVVAAATTSLYAHKEAFAHLLSIERVQRIDQSAAEVDLSVDIMDYYAKCALGLCAQGHLAPIFREKRIGREAQGVIVHVQPSRFPYYSLARFVALNLTIGNVVVLTHAEEFLGCAVAFEHLWLEAGAPIGAFTNVATERCRALSSGDEVMDYRSASVCGGGASIQEVLASTEAGDGPLGLDVFRQSAWGPAP